MIKLTCDTKLLEKQLMKLVNNINDSAKDIVEDGCDLVKAEAKQLCPVVTGALRDSIDTKYVFSGHVYDGCVYSPLDYAAKVEFGTVSRVPKPYLYPAFQKNKDFFIERLKDVIDKGGK